MDNIKANRKVLFANVLSTVLVSGILMGCQGQNPFKRESNPTKNYPNAMQSGNKPYVPGQRAIDAKNAASEKEKANLGIEGVGQRETCFEPLTVKVKPDLGTAALKFSEEVEGSYLITVIIAGEQKGDLIVNKPKDSELRFTGRADNVLNYKFTWKPISGQSSQEKQKLTVGFEGNLPKGACATAKNKVSLDLLVSKSSDVPAVSFKNVKAITFGETLDISVIIDDPKAEKGKAPVVTSITSGVSKDDKILDGKEAMPACQPGRQLEDKKFEYLCQFDSNLLADAQSLIEAAEKSKSGLERSFGVVINAASTASKIRSVPTPVTIKVKFEKIQTKTQLAPLPPPRPKDLAVQGAPK